MSSFRNQFVLVRVLIGSVFVAGILLLTHAQVAADIVLDAFDDSVTVPGPHIDDDDFAVTHNIGDLNARREIRVAGGGTDVVGSFDIDVSSPGRMSVEVDEIIRRISGLLLTSVQLNYYFAPADVTQGGRNDAILFDFVELTGEIQPTFLRAWAVDDTNIGDSFIYELRPLVANHSPHTLVAPFSDFTTRGGAPGTPDATALKTIFFDFFFLGHEGELNWSAKLERIRFGSATVPEPGTGSLLWAAIATWGGFSFRRNGVQRCPRRSPSRAGCSSSYSSPLELGRS